MSITPSLHLFFSSSGFKAQRLVHTDSEVLNSGKAKGFNTGGNNPKSALVTSWLQNLEIFQEMN